MVRLDNLFPFGHISSIEEHRRAQMRWLLSAAIGFWGVGTLPAQPRVAPLPRPIAPCSLTAGGIVLNTTNEVANLPPGTLVSQPLTPVESLETAAIPEQENRTEAVAEDLENVLTARSEPRGLGDSWDNYEFLLWWPKSQPLPPMVAANRFSRPGLGSSDTHVLIGGRSLDPPDQAGGRFTLGRSFTTDNSLGLEATYFFLGTRTETASVRSLDYPQLGFLGVPFFDPVTRTPSAIVLASPGASSARIDVSTTTRAQGAEMNVVSCLVDRSNLRVRGLAGYRFLQVHEGLRSEAFFVNSPVSRGTPTTIGQIADQFDAHNRFNGGQLGLTFDVSRGSMFVEFVGKVALGTNFEVVRVEGQTNTLVGYQPLGLAESVPRGVFAEPTNIGRYTRSVFAVVPEAMLKVGLKLNERGRFFAAYNVLYLSDAVRPGDQIDTTVNPGQIQALGSPSHLGPDRPLPTISRTDFWMQGLVLGLEGRY